MKSNSALDDVRVAAENDLITFIKLVAPQTVMGSVHSELCSWWSRQEAKPHQLTLLPRDHQKSRMIAYRVVWYLTNHPDHRVLYISATANLAEKQLKFMKDILTSKVYRRYWPEMVNFEEGKRSKWTSTEIELDHPKRLEEAVRDPSIFTAGLTTSITGMHCDVAVLDDTVVPENAYSAEGRSKVKSQYSLLSSIEGGDALEWVVGTRYHPKDLYNDLMEMQEEVFDDEGDIVDSIPVYEKFERQVEDRGDGGGEFLWPRQQRGDGKWFGFDSKILATKRAKYLDKVQFQAQYYNNPNLVDGGRIKYDMFQYYDKVHLSQSNGYWHFKGKRLNITAAVDFAYSLNLKADYTAIAVVGVDSDGFYYILDIARFKTTKISDYFAEILRLHTYWGFRKIRAEITAAQKAIVEELKNSYIRPYGLALSVDDHNPTRSSGSKEERIGAILDPRYENQSIWHYQGGNCQLLEEELVQSNPVHDDIKDAVASALEIAQIPTASRQMGRQQNNIVYHSRFGGVAA
jgi:phage terminase large subunit-like protein